MALDSDSKNIFLKYYNSVLEELAKQTVVDKDGKEVPDTGQVTGLPNQEAIDASKKKMALRNQPLTSAAPSTNAPIIGNPAAALPSTGLTDIYIPSNLQAPVAPVNVAPPANQTTTKTATTPTAPATGAPKTAPEGLLASTRMNLLGANQPAQTFSQYRAASENPATAPTKLNAANIKPGQSGLTGIRAAKFDSATNQPLGSTAAKAGNNTPVKPLPPGISQQQMDAFQKAHGTPYNPLSSMDRGKMAQMTGQAGASNAMPGAGNKPGQIKTSTQPAPAAPAAPAANLPPGYVERQNSSLPGILGTASNMLGRVGDTAKNIAMGTVGKVNPQPTTKPAPVAQTKTTAAPKAKPANVNPKVR